MLLAVLFIKLKKSINLSQRDTCVCCGNASGKTRHSGLSFSLQPSFCETAVNGADGDIFRGCSLFCVDGKSHDVLLVSYKSGDEAGTIKLDRKWMKSILEERYGYAVYDCDAFRGKGTHVRRSPVKSGPKQ